MSEAASPLDGRTVRLNLGVTITPPPGASPGHTDAGLEIGERIALQAGLMAQQMAGDGCRVAVEKKITVY